MSNTSSNIIQIDNLAALSAAEFKNLTSQGIALVKITDAVASDLQQITAAGLKYFDLDKQQKEKNRFTPKKREGYLDQNNHGYAIERFISRGSNPAASDIPLNEYADVIQRVRAYYKTHIALPLLRMLFNKLTLSPSYYELITKDPDYTLSLIHYPASENSEQRLQAHQDSVLLTILWTQQPGFEAKINGHWQAVMPKPGYVIVQLGIGTALMTNGKCHAIEHRVTIPENTPRLSISSFFGANDSVLFLNAVTGEKIHESFGEYVRGHVKKVYDRLA